MGHQIKSKIATLFLGIVFIAGCSTAQSVDENTGRSQERPSREEKKRPTTDEIFTQMDVNKDGKLAKNEVKGPLENDFSKIDTNEDGFLTKEELEKAPKPEGKRPPRR